MGYPEGDAEWIREATRLHRRYQVEIVEAHGLCPWAEPARLAGKVRERVLLQPDVEGLAPSVAALADLAAEPTVEVAFLVYPRIGGGHPAFEEFVARVRAADRARYELGKVPFVFAVFHPDAEPDTSDPERLIPFLRRTPDATIQAVRAEVLDAVRGLSSQGTQFIGPAAFEALQSGHAPVPLRERIARTNLATARRVGLDVLSAALDEIRADRERTYARLAAAYPTDSSSTSKTSVEFGGMTGGKPRAP